MIELLRDGGFVSQSAEKGAYLFGLLRELLDADIVGDVRGLGMMFAIEFVADKTTREPLGASAMTKIVEACFARGLFVHVGGNKIILLPPFILDKEQLDEAARVLRKVVSAASNWF